MKSELLQTTKELGPWVLSAVALLQVWVIAAWKRIRHGVVEIHESENIQVGYGAPGLSLSLKGTLRSVRRDVFIKKITATVTRKKDGATHNLLWSSFLAGTRIGSGAPSQNLEPVWSFPLKTSDIYRYNIFLNDPTQVAEQRGKLDRLTRDWGDFVRRKIEEKSVEGSSAGDPQQNPAFSEAIFRDFSQRQDVLDLYRDIDHAMVWQAGEYHLEFAVVCADPERSFFKSWNFRLTDLDVTNLRSNAAATIRASCNLPKSFTFAYPEYASTG